MFFRNDGPDHIFSSFDSVKREDLWTYQEKQRARGNENFSIPHNSNVSNSAMFALHTSYGKPIDKKWAERSARNSPAVEILQTKGSSETHPALSPDDEFASFEDKFTHLLGSGGWNYASNLVNDTDFLEKAYDGGVPMGRDLPAMVNKAPSFAVWAFKDPDSGNLDRVQIIKGWYDKRGYGFQKIYNVAWSDDRKEDANGELPAVGSTVDLESASYTNTIGETELKAVWTDPDFITVDGAVTKQFFRRVWGPSSTISQ